MNNLAFPSIQYTVHNVIYKLKSSDYCGLGYSYQDFYPTLTKIALRNIILSMLKT